MNKRQKKKFEKKMHYKRWVNARNAKMLDAISKIDMEDGDMLHIVSSKDCRRIVGFQILKKVRIGNMGIESFSIY